MKRTAIGVGLMLSIMLSASPAEAAQVCWIAGNDAQVCQDDGSGGVDPGAMPPGYVGGGDSSVPAPAPAAPKPVPAPVQPRPVQVIPAPKPVVQPAAPLVAVPAPVYKAPAPAAPVPVYVAPVQSAYQPPATPAPAYQGQTGAAPTVHSPAAKPDVRSVAKPVAKSAARKAQPKVQAKPKAAVSSKKITAPTPSSPPSPSPKATRDAVIPVSEVKSDSNIFAPPVVGGGLAAAFLAAFIAYRRKRSKRP